MIQHVRTTLEAWRAWGPFFIVLFLPTFFLSRLDSMVHHLTAYELITDFLVLALIFTVPAILLAELTGFLGRKTNAMVVAFATIALMAHYARLGGLPSWLVIVFALAAGIPTWLFRSNLAARVFALLERVSTLALVLPLAGLVLAAANGAFEAAKKPVGPAAALAAAPGKPRPNVILVSFDALSALDMSLYGYQLKTTPNIDRLAESAYVIENAIASGNTTTASTAALTTGRRPLSLRLITNFKPLPAESRELTLPNELRRLGYATYAVVGNPYASPYLHHTVRSYDQVIETSRGADVRSRARFALTHNLGPLMNAIRSHANHWLALLAMDWLGEDSWAESESPAERTFAEGEQLIEQATRAKHPFFLWVHVFPPHDPYNPPVPYLGRFFPADRPALTPEEQRLRYDEHILYADTAFGAFIARLKEKAIFDDALLIVTSDHGESFSRGFLKHAHAGLYQDVVKVPLLIKTPRQSRGVRVKSNAELIDIAPTILDTLGARIPEFMDGESLRPYLDSGAFSQRSKVAVAAKGGTRAAVALEHKIILRPKVSRELYNLASDPGESTNLFRDDATAILDRVLPLFSDQLWVGQWVTQGTRGRNHSTEQNH